MTFAKEMMNIKKKLEEFGHTVFVPLDIKSHVDNPKLIDDLESNYKHAVKTNIMKKCFDLIAKTDAILVLNYHKNRVRGYVGTSSLMEIGLAYYLGKKIFLFNSIPKSRNLRWAHEIGIIQPTILKGDLNRIK